MPQDGGCLLLPIAPGPEGSCTDLWKRGEGEERKRRGEEEGGGGRQGKMGRREEKGEWGKREEEGGRGREGEREEGAEEEGETARIPRYVLHRERCSQIDF